MCITYFGLSFSSKDLHFLQSLTLLAFRQSAEFPFSYMCFQKFHHSCKKIPALDQHTLQLIHGFPIFVPDSFPVHKNTYFIKPEFCGRFMYLHCWLYSNVKSQVPWETSGGVSVGIFWIPARHKQCTDKKPQQFLSTYPKF